MKNLVEYNGFWFSENTHTRVKDIISNNLGRSRRLRFWYGDSNTGESWDEENDVCGYIGRSTGSKKIPLLINNCNSYGGGSILDDCVVKIVDTHSKQVLYQHETFKQGYFTCIGIEVYKNGEIYGRCRTEKSALRLCDFMNGKRMSK